MAGHVGVRWVGLWYGYLVQGGVCAVGGWGEVVRRVIGCDGQKG